MRFQPSFLWSWNRTIDRGPYFCAGAILALVKFGLDWTIATWLFGKPWLPYSYLIWPDIEAVRVFELPEAELRFSLALVVTSLPFIWTGVLLTVRRLRAIQLPIGLAAFFFVPVANWLLFLMLAILPSRPPLNDLAVLPRQHIRFRRLPAQNGLSTPGGTWTSAALALAISLPITVGLVALGAEVLQTYGFGLFVGAPFFLGFLSVVLFGIWRPQPFTNCVMLAIVATTLAGLAIFLVAMEGLICLLMAAPIAYVLAFLGAVVGYAIQQRPWLSDSNPTMCLGLTILLPSLMFAEAASEPLPILREVRTSLVIDAAPDKVWQHVIAFPPLQEPTDWLFCSGIAYPQRAELQGFGVGAVRYCVFSTGSFVEPIEYWEPPHKLGFRVTEQPPPMREWSLFDTQPAHLDHYLVSRRGQFQLKDIGGGRTRLEGTTWYTNKMWPAPYWCLWSDYIIQRIHLRVLEHIGELAKSS